MCSSLNSEPDFTAALAQMQAQSRYRQRRSHTSPCGTRMVFDGQPRLAFASNDYLGRQPPA